MTGGSSRLLIIVARGARFVKIGIHPRLTLTLRSRGILLGLLKENHGEYNLDYCTHNLYDHSVIT